jgi:ferritin-like metal-binding protein YciE
MNGIVSFFRFRFSVVVGFLVSAAQRVEHYEIAGSGTARTLARRVGKNEIAGLLQQTLNEEGEADKKLTSIAESHINVGAVRS